MDDFLQVVYFVFLCGFVYGQQECPSSLTKFVLNDNVQDFYIDIAPNPNNIEPGKLVEENLLTLGNKDTITIYPPNEFRFFLLLNLTFKVKNVKKVVITEIQFNNEQQKSIIKVGNSKKTSLVVHTIPSGITRLKAVTIQFQKANNPQVASLSGTFCSTKDGDDLEGCPVARQTRSNFRNLNYFSEIIKNGQAIGQRGLLFGSGIKTMISSTGTILVTQQRQTFNLRTVSFKVDRPVNYLLKARSYTAEGTGVESDISPIKVPVPSNGISGVDNVTLIVSSVDKKPFTFWDMLVKGCTEEVFCPAPEYLVTLDNSHTETFTISLINPDGKLPADDALKGSDKELSVGLSPVTIESKDGTTDFRVNLLEFKVNRTSAVDVAFFGMGDKQIKEIKFSSLNSRRLNHVVIDRGALPQSDNLPNDGLPGVKSIVISFPKQRRKSFKLSGVFLKACNDPGGRCLRRISDSLEDVLLTKRNFFVSIVPNDKKQNSDKFWTSGIKVTNDVQVKLVAVTLPGAFRLQRFDITVTKAKSLTVTLVDKDDKNISKVIPVATQRPTTITLKPGDGGDFDIPDREFIILILQAEQSGKAPAIINGAGDKDKGDFDVPDREFLNLKAEQSGIAATSVNLQFKAAVAACSFALPANARPAGVDCIGGDYKRTPSFQIGSTAIGKSMMAATNSEKVTLGPDDTFYIVPDSFDAPFSLRRLHITIGDNIIDASVSLYDTAGAPLDPATPWESHTHPFSHSDGKNVIEMEAESKGISNVGYISVAYKSKTNVKVSGIIVEGCPQKGCQQGTHNEICDPNAAKKLGISASEEPKHTRASARSSSRQSPLSAAASRSNLINIFSSRGAQIPKNSVLEIVNRDLHNIRGLVFGIDSPVFGTMEFYTTNGTLKKLVEIESTNVVDVDLKEEITDILRIVISFNQKVKVSRTALTVCTLADKCVAEVEAKLLKNVPQGVTCLPTHPIILPCNDSNKCSSGEPFVISLLGKDGREVFTESLCRCMCCTKGHTSQEVLLKSGDSQPQEINMMREYRSCVCIHCDDKYKV